MQIYVTDCLRFSLMNYYQSGGYVTYFARSKKGMCTTYCGTLFVGQCTADDMLLHLHEFMKKAGLDSKFMWSLGMDGPNVNLLSQNKLLKEVQSWLWVRVLCTGQVPVLAKQYCQSKKVLQILMKWQLSSIFSLSILLPVEHREEYKKCDEITGIVPKHMQRHCETHCTH